MKLWKRASGVLKDQNSIWLATLSRRTALRNPEIELAVIKSTSHDETHVDYRNAQRVFSWVRVSPANLKPLVWAISKRMEKTRCWVVALKGLMLMHGVFCCKVPAIQRIGRLPFDLSNFEDGHTKIGDTWAHNEFIRAYYSFLDQKSSFIFLHAQELRKGNNKPNKEREDKSSMMQELVWLQKMQGLLDMLLQIKPKAESMVGILVLEAMDCVVIEIFDINSRKCSGIVEVLTKIYSVGKVEATMALKILQKANEQGEELSLYFEFCRDIGVINAADCPKIERIPDQDIQELEEIINGVSEKKIGHKQVDDLTPEEVKSLVTVSLETQKLQDLTRNHLQTIITSRWEMFDEDKLKNGGKVDKVKEEPLLPLIDLQEHGSTNNKELPDLISFD